MISKQEVIAYNTQESAMLRYIDSELLKYSGKVFEFSVEQYPQDLLDKWITVYQRAGWEITQINRMNRSGYGKRRFWRVK
jgi:hypothetical protein